MNVCPFTLTTITFRHTSLGGVWRVGLQPTSTYVYVPVEANHDKLQHYGRVGMSLPTLHVNFVYVDLADELDLRSTRERAYRLVTHGVGYSLCVCLPSADNLQGRNHDCYVIPSEVLNVDNLLHDYNEEIFKNTKSGTRRKGIRLKNRKLYTAYRCPENELLALFENLCRAWAGSSADMDLELDYSLYEPYMDKIIGTKLEQMKTSFDMAVSAVPNP